MKTVTKNLPNKGRIAFNLILMFTLFQSISYSQNLPEPINQTGPNSFANMLNCNGTPTFEIDLTGQPGGTWISNPEKRAGDCCNPGGDVNCVQFTVTLDPLAEGIVFNVPDGCGAAPSGSLFYQVDCGPLTSVGTPLCLNGNGPFVITFCKPGNNENCYSISSIPAPASGGDVITADGCTDTLSVSGLAVASITWTSLSPGTTGQYNNYLNSLAANQPGTTGVTYTGQSTVVVTPQPGYPPVIYYKVCGNVIGACSSTSFCDTVSVSIYPNLFANAGPDVAICNGSIVGTVVTGTSIGGTAPFTYHWTGPGGFNQTNISPLATNSITAMVPGVYTLTLTDATGCPSATDQVSVTSFNVDITAAAGPDILICRDPIPSLSINGTVSQTGSGIWSGGTGTYNSSNTDLSLVYTPSAAEIASGSVTLTLTPTNTLGCPYTADQVVISLPQFTSTLSAIPTGISCFGLTNGSIDLNVTGGAATTSYAWSNGPTTQDISGLALGSYSVTVTDANGCKGTTAAVISQPTQLTASITSQTNASCFGGNNGSVTVSGANATPNYMYAINGGTPQTSGTFSGLSTGSYTVTVIDANGCTTTITATITQPLAAMSATSSQTNVVCLGGTTGAINLTPIGGTAPYTYSWSNGATTEDVSSLAAGTYTVNVHDFNGATGGCATTATITITQPLTALTLTNTLTNVSCFGGANGTIDLTPSGGTPGYFYSWSTGATTQDVAGLAIGTYTVTVHDANGTTGGCAAVASITIVQPAAALSLSNIPTNVTCFGASTGAINLTPANGTPGYTYAWSNGANTEDVSGLAAGTYTVSVHDANGTTGGCAAIATITIAQPAAPVALSTIPTNVVCFGGSSGIIDLSVTGGTAPYSYLWSNGSISQDISGLSAGTYSVIVNDAAGSTGGCSATISVSITQPLVPVSLSATQTNVLCFGGSNGAVNLSVNGGTSPYFYLWSNGATTQNISGLTAGTYSVVVNDAAGNSGGCTSSMSVIITEPIAPVSVSTSPNNVLCFGGTTGSINITPSGGTPNYTYLWSNGATTQNISGLAAGTYTVVISDQNGSTGGCTVTASVLITQPPLLTSSILPSVYSGGYNLSGCLPDGSANLSVNGGIPGYTYSWSNSATTQDISNLLAGTYNVTITDLNGCQTTNTVTLTAPNSMTQTISAFTYPSGTNISCFGLSDGSVDLTINGGAPSYSYAWSNGATTQDLTNVPAGTYNVTITDANGCQIISSIVLTEPVVLNQTISAFTYPSGTNISCNGLSDGSIDLAINGGSPGYSYSWSNGSTVEDPSGLAAGTYSVTVTDINGCSIPSAITLTEPTLLTSSVTPSLFAGGYNISGCTPDGTIDLSVAGGNSGYTYSWSNGSTAEDLSSLPAGTYSVTATDMNGCQTTSTITLTAPNAMTQTISAFTYPSGTNISCFGLSDGSVDLAISGGAPSYSYAWSNGATTQDLTNVPAGTYNVTITDANGCQIISSIVLTEPTVLTESLTSFVYPSGTNISCNGLSDGSIDLSIGGGSPGYSYSWSNGSTVEDPNGLAAGTYTVTVTDQNGCLIPATITLAQPTLLTSSLTPSLFAGGYNISGCTPDGTIDLFVTGGNSGYTYSWSNGSNSEDLSSLSAGTYSVTATDMNGCQTTSTITLTAPNAMTQSITAFTYPSGTNISCFGLSDGSIDLTISGGSPGYTYLWDSGQTTQDLTNVPVGTYNVTVTDANGCQIISSIVLTEPLVLNQTISAFTYPSGTNISCNGLSDGSIDLAISGGSPGYSYSWSNGSTVEDPSGLAAGTYSVTVTDINGCSIPASITLVQPTILTSSVIPSLFAGGYNISGCIPDGTIDLSVTGGNSGYTYSWSNGSNSEDLSSLPAGTYSVTATDMNGCQTTSTITLNAPNAMTQSIAAFTYPSGTNISCFGLSDGSVDLTINGGAPAHTYVWSNGATTQDLTGVPAGTYNVTVTDANGCQITSSIILTEPAVLEQTVSAYTYPSGTNISCFGLSDGSIDLSISGGSPGYSYSWSNGSIVQDPNGLVAGTYTVTITDINGCSIPATITLLEPTLLTSDVDLSVFAGGYNLSGCNPDGSINLTVAGGNPGYTYAWSTSEIVEDINNLAAGPYSVTVTDINGCQTTIDTTLTQPMSINTTTLVTSDYNGQDISCRGASDGAITVNILGGTPQFTFEWLNSDGVVVSNLQSPNGLPADTYTVNIIDQNGCTGTNSIIVTEPALFEYTIVVSTNYNGEDISCFGYSDGGINLTFSGGTPGYTFDWTNSAGAAISSVEDPQGLPEGHYFVLITDVNGCTYNTDISLSQPTNLIGETHVVTNYNGQHVSCFTATDAAIDVIPNGGTPGYSFNWTNTGGTTLGSNTTLGNIGQGTYYVQIVDLNGCLFTTTVDVLQPSLLTSGITIISDFDGQAVSCDGAFDGIVEANVSGGTPGYTYEWNTNPIQTTPQATNLGVGSYTVTVTDVNGCVSTSNVELNANPLPGFNLPEVVYGCMGNSVELNSQADPGSSCTWSFSDGQIINDCGPILVDFAYQDCYDMSLVLVNQFGCIDSISIDDFICIMPNPLAGFYAEEEELTNIQNDTHFWNTSMGAETYLWDFGDGSPTDTSTNTQHVFISNDDFNTITFPVILYAITEYGCTDTAVRYIKVSPDLIFYVPNAFTPDGDMYNNVFKPVFSSGYSYDNYQLLIFNRWGEVVFETQEIQEGWDGTYRGDKAQDGVYTWKLKVNNSISDRKEEHVGHVSLIKGEGIR